MGTARGAAVAVGQSSPSRQLAFTTNVCEYVCPPAVSFAVNEPVSVVSPPPRPKPRPRPPPATGVHTTRCIPAVVANGSGVGRHSGLVFGIPPPPRPPPPPPPPPRPPTGCAGAVLEKVATA